MKTETEKPKDFYLTFTKSHNQMDAVRRFVERFGRQPEQIKVEGMTLKLGPVAKDETK
jgi:hypothetical protein